jgi:DNA-binding NarL/FixJ family response regulator
MTLDATSPALGATTDSGRKLDPTTIATNVAAEAELSQRETQVLVSAARGICNKEIANALGISGKTVDHFWKQIFRKLACDSHGQVMALLLRRACDAKEFP